MAEEKKTPVSSKESKAGAGGAIGSILALREENPTLFYSSLAALIVLVLLLFYMMTRGAGEVEYKPPAIQVGQEVTLQNPNVTTGGKVLLIEAPGQILSEDVKEREKQVVCVVDGGTRARVLEKQTLNMLEYVKVEPVEGECAGKQGWTSLVNVKP